MFQREFSCLRRSQVVVATINKFCSKQKNYHPKRNLHCNSRKLEIQVQSMDQGGKEKIPSFHSVMFLNE
jgi:hypothetical protein